MAPQALELIGRLADGWVPGGGISQVDELPGMAARIDDAAGAAGRDPGAIRRILNLAGSITDGPLATARSTARWTCGSTGSLDGRSI